ncbi:MAG: hypothetical protein R3A44_44340 [Caldilineaceae bacterium]
MSLSDYMGLIGVLLLAIAVYLAMGTPATLAFIGMTMLITSVFMARNEAKRNGDFE